VKELRTAREKKSSRTTLKQKHRRIIRTNTDEVNNVDDPKGSCLVLY